jgi:hypothetical protein
MRISDLPPVQSDNASSYTRAVQEVREALAVADPLKFALFSSLLRFEFNAATVPTELQGCLLAQELLDDPESDDHCAHRVAMVLNAIKLQAQLNGYPATGAMNQGLPL